MYEELLESAVAAAEAGAEELRGSFRRRGLAFESKGETDLVSEADRASEKAIVAVLHERHPGHPVLAEEAGWMEGRNGSSEFVWVVDPLDGTNNFVQGLPIFGVSVACLEGTRVVAGVVLEPEGGTLYTATRGGGARRNGKAIAVAERKGVEGSFLATGFPFRSRPALDLYLSIFRDVFRRARAVRRCGSAALDLAWTAAGVFDGFFEFRLSAWDVAAGALLIEEAGGLVTDLDGGDRYLATGNVVAGSPRLHAELLALVAAHADERRLDRIVPSVTSTPDPAC